MNKNLKYFIIFFFLLLTNKTLPLTNRNLLMFCEFGSKENILETLNHDINDQKPEPKGLGAISVTFLTTLYQEAGPILIPEPLLNTILEHKVLFDEFINGNVNTLFKKYNIYKRFKTKALVQEFFDLCHYFNNMYEHLQHFIKIHKTENEIQAAIWNDPLFEKSNAPKAIINQTRPWINYGFSQFLLCSKIPFNKFLIKELTSERGLKNYLFIPISYIKKIHPTYSITKINKNKPINTPADELEKLIGLKINHFKDADIKIPTTFSQVTGNTKIYRDSLIEVFKKIFVKKNELTKEEDPLLSHAFYMNGHGNYRPEITEILINKKKEASEIKQAIKDNENKLQEFKKNLETTKKKKTTQKDLEKEIIYLKDYIEHLEQKIKEDKKNLSNVQNDIKVNLEFNRIIGLTIPEFQEILKFLNDQIITGFLFYSSCYSGGQHFIDPYKEITTGTPLELNFTVATDTLNETTTERYVPIVRLRWYKDGKTLYKIPMDRLINLEKKEIIIHSPYNFPEFFRVLEQKPKKLVTYRKLFSYLSIFYKEVESTLKNLDYIPKDILKNVPSIRFPGTNWFNVIDFDKHLLALTKIKVLTQGNKPLIINKIKKETDAILLYEKEIPFSLDVNKPDSKSDFPAIVSMIPEKATHTIQEINAPKFELSEIIASLLPISLTTSKLFKINKIIAINNLAKDKPAIKTEFKNIVIANKAKLLKTDPERQNFLFFTINSDVYQAKWKGGEKTPKDLAYKIEGSTILDYESKLSRYFKTEEEKEKTPEEKFTGIVETTEGKETVKIDPLIKFLKEKYKKMEEMKLQNIRNSLNNLEISLKSLFKAKNI